MKPADGKIKFGPWLPDLPDLDNPGLTDAKNVIPIPGAYRPFNPMLSVYDVAVNARPQGAFLFPAAPTGHTDYVGTSTKLYVAGTDRSGAVYTTASTGFWRFAEYRGTIIATNGNDVPQRHTYTSASNFAALAVTGTAPTGRHVGTIGQFVVLGRPHSTNLARIQWSAIDDPTNWPTPGSAAALAVQSGAQDFDVEFGFVTGIVGSDQYGLVFQHSGITRVTYEGGATVFGFNQFEYGRGAFFENATVQAAGWTYFIGIDGFYRTNGVQVESIGEGRVNKWFFSQLDKTYCERVYGAHYGIHGCVVWSIPTSASTGGRPKLLLFYSYTTDRWSYADQENECLTGIRGAISNTSITFGTSIIAYNSSHQPVLFNGTPGTAILTSGEAEFAFGARTNVLGVKPLIQHSSTVTATVAVGKRSRLDTAPTYSAEITPSTVTGFAGMSEDDYFHRARTTITGDFEKAIGIEFQDASAGCK